MDIEQSQHHEHHHDASMAKAHVVDNAKKPSCHHDHHGQLVEDFRKRFGISLVLTLPILILSPMVQEFVGLGEKLRFSGDQYLLWAFQLLVLTCFLSFRVPIFEGENWMGNSVGRKYLKILALNSLEILFQFDISSNFNSLQINICKYI